MDRSYTGRVAAATLRRAVIEDAAAVADVLIGSRRAAGDAIPPAVHSDDEVREWVRTVVVADREVWLAEDADQRPLGVLVLHEDWVDQLYVAPDSTGTGLGSRLIQLAKARRPDGLQLWTFASNTGAQRFYLRHGFVVAETTDGAGNEERAPDIRFVWPGP
ncbi:GNAT family N-acetyltransferase [Dactylosporangium aurantiacum]|uniref:GNAT family N-acetyltransferase n=1 Tax=Dactylosporangium aurantiacum TaxID=35754 RepID=A0A9Q9IJ79_9ACTN|nr:GNAT family N-acetyltransferase [Dactylosporangium aurantiacum]MDG6105550.1 GNAT family N-acetyltransferase [Dactylosporangium aurantiacum]UWZ57107.1 GNAT family N-acetyltransferase [Dactylosporangium aurantiacum]